MVWILFLILASGATSTHGATISSAIQLPGESNHVSLLTALHKDNGNATFTTYEAYQIDVETFETGLYGVVENANT